MAEPFSVRAAQEADSELILQMIREMATAEQRQEQVRITEDDLAQYVFGEHPIAEVFLGFWEGDPVAYLMIQSRFSSYQGRPILYVEDVFVRARSRGHGLGKRLMEFAAKLAVQRNCYAVNWSVVDWNGPALAFYDRLGSFREKGRVHFSLEGDALEALARQAIS